jgi:predicted transposase/invertase (TIGR01784 family)
VSAAPKKWEELGISNDFLFGKVMQTPELCQEMLQIIFPDLDIHHIEYPELQKSIDLDIDAHGIRLDLYVNDDKHNIYNVEMQMSETGELPKRSRYYQSIIDLQLIDKGESYHKLNHSYIIFICPFDVFKKGRHIYTFRNICEEDTEIFLNDETAKIFLNAEGTLDDVSKDLRAFLDLIAGKPTVHPFVEKIEQAVIEAKKNRKWRREYMNLLMRDQENLEKGIEQGVANMIANALKVTKSIQQTASILCLDENFVKKVANEKGISVNNLF